MFAKTFCATIEGLNAIEVTVEVFLSRGLHSFQIVGLGDTAVKEARERVRGAIINSGFKFPKERITVNLAPGNLKKAGPAYDLAIACGILCASGQLELKDPHKYIFLGELSLSGNIRPVRGVFPVALSVLESGMDKIMVIPEENRNEISCLKLPWYSAPSLGLLACGQMASPCLDSAAKENSEVQTPFSDLSDVQGQETLKRALEIAASGGHNLILIGPPGSGKSMLAKRIPSILPDMTREEQIECSRIYSIMGLLKGEEGLLKQRPFRSPHHTSSDVSLIGGGSNAKPGEVSLAHNGVLFLDEMPEFKKSVLEVLRQPMNDGVIHISRANAYASYPARFMMVAAMNPCPCGYSGDPEKHCCCSHEQILRYRSRISGPIMDRIDLQLYSPRVKIQDLNRRGESSNQIRKRVQKARMIQQDRFKDAGIYANAQMESIQLRDFCKLTDNAAEELNRAVEQYGFSNRGYTKVLKIARTIADLDEKESIAQEHICEAIYLRTMAESI